ncbi:TenA family protein [Nesterenkonia sp. HG001]|uniref:TenA family protein n=1 Tax=Nesterenkonia sp. HG001 TaxID=2983207 RepID=UPI002AC40815|nr:TenA family protein [Nesterenkonia sp. HG001]MDZ5076649.1 TenA family protein [Nesterenkonia sp. HG001]
MITTQPGADQHRIGPAPYVDSPALCAGDHGLTAWRHSREALARISSLEFLAELAAGTLPAETFVHYLLQDSAYLAGYGQAMTLLAARAPSAAHRRFWARATSDTIAEEQAMQAELMSSAEFSALASEMADEHDAPRPSPTTQGYTSWLVATAAVGDHAVAVAAVLPCFWVYAEVGRHLVEDIGEAMAHHPYRSWVQVYSDPEFDQAVEEAIGIFEQLYEGADGALRARMLAAFEQGCVYEHRFWAAAHVRESWRTAPVG